MKTKAPIKFKVTAKLICVFVFAYAKSRFSHDVAHIWKAQGVPQSNAYPRHQDVEEKPHNDDYSIAENQGSVPKPRELIRTLKLAFKQASIRIGNTGFAYFTIKPFIVHAHKNHI